MPWYHGVVERHHEIQNPTTAEKIRLLGERLRLGPESMVLDVASGRGGPALVLAQTFGCHITFVERAEEFHQAAVARVRGAGLDRQVELVHADARAFSADDFALRRSPPSRSSTPRETTGTGTSPFTGWLRTSGSERTGTTRMPRRSACGPTASESGTCGGSGTSWAGRSSPCEGTRPPTARGR